jgi:hypothetical protein
MDSGRAIAAQTGARCCFMYASTPGNLETPTGKEAQRLIDKTPKWSEKYLDLSDEEIEKLFTENIDDNGVDNGGSTTGGNTGSNTGGNSGSGSVTQSVSAPTFSGATQFTESTQVSMSGPAGAEIRYTTNGSTPTAQSTLYSGPLTLTETTTVKAIAIKDGQSSAVTSRTYSKVEAGGGGEDEPGGDDH